MLLQVRHPLWPVLRLTRFLLCIVFSGGLALAGPARAAPDYVPDDSVLQRLDPDAARQALKGWSGLKFTNCNNCIYQEVADIGVTEEGTFQITRIGRSDPVWIKLWALKIDVERYAFGTEAGIHLYNNWRLWTGRNFEGAKRIADALYVLKRHAEGYEDPKVEAAFQQALQAQRANASAPEFPETARRHRVLAEAAIRDKDFPGASEQYARALAIAPGWVEGRFNRALILGELKRYTEATREMKRYLQLVPDAANARAAQDKIYEWEAKAK